MTIIRWRAAKREPHTRCVTRWCCHRRERAMGWWILGLVVLIVVVVIIVNRRGSKGAGKAYDINDPNIRGGDPFKGF